MEDLSRYQDAKAMARERRWMAPGKSKVVHPNYGTVVVPHSSSLAAVENAAEFWGVDLMEIIHGARAWVCGPEDGPVRVPREFAEKRARMIKQIDASRNG